MDVLLTVVMILALSGGVWAAATGAVMAFNKLTERREKACTRAAVQEHERRKLGDYLAESIDELWLETCEVDPVQLWLRDADQRKMNEESARRARVLQPVEQRRYEESLLEQHMRGMQMLGFAVCRDCCTLQSQVDLAMWGCSRCRR